MIIMRKLAMAAQKMSVFLNAVARARTTDARMIVTISFPRSLFSMF